MIVTRPLAINVGESSSGLIFGDSRRTLASFLLSLLAFESDILFSFPLHYFLGR